MVSDLASLGTTVNKADLTKISCWNGMNQDPTIYFQKWATAADAPTKDVNTTKLADMPDVDGMPPALITNADKTVRARVRRGEVPDGKAPDADGTIHYVPVGAYANEYSATLKDSVGNTVKGKTDANGFITDNSSKFQQTYSDGGSGDLLVKLDDTNDQDTAIVKDVTPPTPAKLDNSGISVVDKVIKGHGATPGDTVTYTVIVNGTATDSGLSATVDADGNWSIDAPASGFKAGDKVQIFMTDPTGNKNPTISTNFNDATFPPATLVTVQDTSAVKPYNPYPDTNPGDNTDDTNNPGTGQNAVLTIDNVPNNLNFGDNQFINTANNSFTLKDGGELANHSGTTEQYPNTSYSNGKGSPNPHVIFTQVTDRNPGGSNWKLNMNSTQALVSDDGNKTKIDGASMTLKLPQAQVLSSDKASWLSATADLNTVPSGSNGTDSLSLDGNSSMTIAQVIAGSDAAKKAGTYQVVWALNNVQLNIPQQSDGGKGLKDKGFTTTVDWELVNGL